MHNLKMDVVETIIREVAQKEIIPRYRHLSATDIDFKIGDDPVTIADKQAEIELSKRLLPLLNGSKVVGEEGFFENPAISEAFFSDSYVWVIDPVDGTRNFVAGNERFGTIVSLVKQNKVVAGWLYNPFEDSFISGERGSGVFYKGRKLSILPPAPLTEMRGNLGLVVDECLHNQKENGIIDPKAPQVSPCLLSVLYEYAQLLLNAPDFSLSDPQWHFHAFYDYCSPWDNAAGIFFHEECGGYSAFWDGSAYSPSRYGRDEVLKGKSPCGPLSAPDKESWHLIRDWVATLLPLSPEKA